MIVAMVELAEVVTVDEAVVGVGIAFGHKLDFGGRIVNRVGGLGPGGEWHGEERQEDDEFCALSYELVRFHAFANAKKKVLLYNG